MLIPTCSLIFQDYKILNEVQDKQYILQNTIRLCTFLTFIFIKL